MDFFIQHAEQINHLTTAATAVILAVIAILTFIRAKETILQPIRTEVIKKQADLLERLLRLLKHNQTYPLEGLDYENLVTLNVLYLAKQHGFKFSDDAAVDRLLEDNYGAGAVITAEFGTNLEDVEVITAFNSKFKQSDQEKQEKSKLLYKNGLEGEVKIQRILLTKRHSDFVNEVRELQEDPLMPSKIKDELAVLLDQVKHSLTVSLKEVLVSVMARVYDKHKSGKTFPLNPIGVFNEFNRVRIDHNNSFNSINSKIREYLKVDSMY